MTTEKACFKCHRCLPLEQFYAHPMMGDKHLGKCKECTRKDVQEHRELHRDKWRAWDRARYRAGKVPPKGPPEKERARILLRNAVARRKIEKPTSCEGCGQHFEPRRIQAHHRDYSRPLDVMWLCSVCHGKEHRMDAGRRHVT